jgi:DNA invertase Pin-like site-specific DNA recombinase
VKTITQIQFAPAIPTRKRTAAYTRVSSGKDAMLHSLSAQVSYYSDLIQSRADWEFAGIYCDEAVTGTKDRRAEFQRLLADCRAGKIDQVITKSITRFARNTVDLLKTIRELKLLGIDVFFQEQNIHTLSAEGEMVLSILAANAQEQSLRVSENCKWRIRKDFREGKVCGMSMLGYRLHCGRLVIIPEEATLVRQIFVDYLKGMGINAIVRKCLAQGLKMSETGLQKMLRNEKYTGNMLLQKTYVVDHLTKQARINNGELPKYFVENSHEAIIPHEQFEAVQREIQRRAAIHQPHPRAPRAYPLTGLVKCGVCGAGFRHKIVGAAQKYKKPVWICDTFNMRGKEYCANQQIPEDMLLAKVAEAGGFDGLQKIVAVPGTLAFHYNNGNVIELTWQNPSRAGSWTPEMREAARQRAVINAQKRRESQQ